MGGIAIAEAMACLPAVVSRPETLGANVLPLRMKRLPLA